MHKKGTLYWVTGLSGAGKTTIGTLLHERLSTVTKVILLDGDKLRGIYGDDIGYSLEERKKMAIRNVKLCELLTEQGVDVVCCTIAMFHSVREWNREHIENYREIYLEVSKEILIQRDQKKLYSHQLVGKSKNVMGMDLDFEAPLNPDIVIKNNGILTPKQVVDEILNQLEMR